MGLITVIEAKCKDCYKCVRSCPVKAIRIHQGHAEVVEERCILDGRCITVCPQHAKKVASDVDHVRGLISSGARVIAGLAPSFISAFHEYGPRRLVSILKKLGFQDVQETAFAAEFVAREHARVIAAGRRPLISSSCPAIANLLEQYYPHLLGYLAPVVSPMVAHGRLIKRFLGEDVAYVFIGPCVAKKNEARDKHVKGAVDGVLTFDELAAWILDVGLDLAELPEEDFMSMGDLYERMGGYCDEILREARYFPMAGGLARTAGIEAGLLAEDLVTISGIEECMDYFSKFPIEDGPDLVEALACNGGCLAGPGLYDIGLQTGDDLYSRRRKLLEYARLKTPYGDLGSHGGVGKTEAGEDGMKGWHQQGPIILPLRRTYGPRDIRAPQPTEEDIRKILAATGKLTPEDELNCGACGYDSCRAKALAVFQGMAEIEMCIPYMRKRAESMAQVTFNLTPNGIIIVDRDLKILDINPAIENKFQMRRDAVVGRHLEDFLDARVFRNAIEKNGLASGEVEYPAYGLVTSQTAVYVEDQGLVVGVIADITQERAQRDRLRKMQEETLMGAQEVITRQMRVAQEIAGLLGETTAETKLVLTRLMKLMGRGGDGDDS
ncbi:MAG TPA: 4Fe-4S binding protein [Firmicutes bacterium]|nr:4Fe-4S binding protein [Bacillota bacterium]